MCFLWLCEIVSNIPDTFSSSLKDYAFLLILQPLAHSEPKEQDLRCPKMFLFLSTTHAYGICAQRFARRMSLHHLILSISVCHPSFFSRLIYISFKFLLFIFSKPSFKIVYDLAGVSKNKLRSPDDWGKLSFFINRIMFHCWWLITKLTSSKLPLFMSKQLFSYKTKCEHLNKC